MSAYLNQVSLMGNVGKPPEIKTFTNGDKVAQFSLATTEKWTDKTTQQTKDKTYWHRIVVKNQNLIKVVESYVSKGSHLYLEGQIQYREYEKDSKKEYITEIVLSNWSGIIKLLGKKEDSGNATETKSKQDYSYNDLDDEVPF